MRDPEWSTFEKRTKIQKSIHLRWILLPLSVSYFKSKFWKVLKIRKNILGLGQNWSNKQHGNLNLSLVATVESVDFSWMGLITVRKLSETVSPWWSKDEMVVPANSALEKALAASDNYWYAEYTVRCNKLILKFFLCEIKCLIKY